MSPARRVGLLLLVSVLLFWGGWVVGRRSVSAVHADLIGQVESYAQVRDDLATLRVEYREQSDLVQAFRTQLARRPTTVHSLAESRFASRGGRRPAILDGATYPVYLSQLDGSAGPPIGGIRLGPPMESITYDHEIRVSHIIERDPATGRYTIYAQGTFTLVDPRAGSGWLNQPLPLPVTGGRVVIDPTQSVAVSKRLWWRPGLTLGGGWEFPRHVVVQGTVFPLHYGEHVGLADWKALGVGLSGGTGSMIRVHLSPFIYNVGRATKVLHNVYMGPHASVGWSGDVRWGVSVHVGL